MASLSIVRDDGPTTLLANPLFMLDPIVIVDGAEARFEVFDVDAGMLKSLVGKHQCFYMDSVGIFWAQIKSLELCTSTHPGLALLRNRPTLRGTFVMRASSTRMQ